jgi:hypothetical protein
MFEMAASAASCRRRADSSPGTSVRGRRDPRALPGGDSVIEAPRVSDAVGRSSRHSSTSATCCRLPASTAASVLRRGRYVGIRYDPDGRLTDNPCGTGRQVAVNRRSGPPRRTSVTINGEAGGGGGDGGVSGGNLQRREPRRAPAGQQPTLAERSGRSERPQVTSASRWRIPRRYGAQPRSGSKR